MIEITINKQSLNRVKEILGRLDSDKQDNCIKRGIMAASEFVLKRLLYNISNVILKRRTGNLAMSMGYRLERQGKNWTGILGSGALVVNPAMNAGGQDVKANKNIRMMYANILETGGIITPTEGRKFLTIPLRDAMTSSGVARFTALQLKNGQAPGYQGSVIIGGVIFGIRELKKRSVLTPLFILKRSVTIPAKRYLSITAEQTALGVGYAMEQEIERELKR